jgi:small subunit ribosomal protein S4e
MPPRQIGDTVMLNIDGMKIRDHIKFDIGNIAMITGGHNCGRVGTILSKEKHKGSFDIIHLEDALGQRFATRGGNVFAIGTGNKPMISLPKGKGLRRCGPGTIMLDSLWSTC